MINSDSVQRSITAQNQFTDPIRLCQSFNISIDGSFPNTTVSLQRSFDNGSTWLTVQNFTTAIECSGYEIEQITLYRIGVATGNYGSGTIFVRLGQPNNPSV